MYFSQRNPKYVKIAGNVRGGMQFQIITLRITRKTRISSSITFLFTISFKEQKKRRNSGRAEIESAESGTNQMSPVKLRFGICLMPYNIHFYENHGWRIMYQQTYVLQRILGGSRFIASNSRASRFSTSLLGFKS